MESQYTPEAFAATTPGADKIRQRFDEGPIWVALNGGEIVGTVSVLPEGERLYIRSMAVSKAAQGKGVGPKLLAEIERYVAGKGFDRLYLYTTHFLVNAIKLYQRNGFEIIRESGPEEFFGTAGVEMEKNL